MRFLTYLFLASSPLLATTYNCATISLAGGSGIAQGFNNAGTISGYYTLNQAYHGFLQNPSTGSFATVTYPGSAVTKLYGINNNGIAVGEATVYFTYDSNNGTFKTVTVQPQYSIHQIFGINDSGAISATLVDNNASSNLVFAIINPDASVTPLPLPTVGQVGNLNNSNQIVEQSIFPQLGDPSGNQIVIDYPGFTNQNGTSYRLSGTGLNNAGVFLGLVQVPQGYTPFLFDSASATYSQLFCPGFRPGNLGWVAINDSGTIVSSLAIGTPLPGLSQTSLSSTSITFPPSPVGQASATQTLTITNSGNQRLDIGNIRFGYNSQMQVGESGCLNQQVPATLDPGASCTVSITATPVVNGSQSVALYIEDTSPGSPRSVPVTVTGSTPPPPTCTISDTNPGPPATVTFTMSDVLYGLRSVQLTQSANAAASIPAIADPKSPLVVNAQQVTPGQPSSVQFLVTNKGGSSTTCGSNFAASGGGTISWIGLNGSIAGRPAVASNQSGALEVFARDIGNTVDDIKQNAPNGAWTAWQPRGGYIAGNPALISNTNGRLAAAVRGTDNAIWYAEQPAPGGTWSSWSSLGGTVVSDPVAAVNASGTLDIFALGTDNSVWHIAQTSPDGAWGGWSGIGGNLAGLPAVIRNADGRLEVFGRETGSNALVHAWQTTPGGSWSAWASLGGFMTGNPAVAVNADGRVQAFVPGSDSSLWTNSQSTAGSTTWSGFSGLGGTITADPAVAVNKDGRIEAFVRGTDNALWHSVQSSAGSASWSGWTGLQGNFLDAVSPVVNSSGVIEIFARAPDNTLWFISQTAPGSWN